MSKLQNTVIQKTTVIQSSFCAVKDCLLDPNRPSCDFGHAINHPSDFEGWWTHGRVSVMKDKVNGLDKWA